MAEIDELGDAITGGGKFLRILIAAALVGAAYSLKAQSSVGPKPTGPYSVGRTVFRCIDPNRGDPVAPGTMPLNSDFKQEAAFPGIGGRLLA
jgi:hypothetical protein